MAHINTSLSKQDWSTIIVAAQMNCISSIQNLSKYSNKAGMPGFENLNDKIRYQQDLMEKCECALDEVTGRHNVTISMQRD